VQVYSGVQAAKGPGLFYAEAIVAPGKPVATTEAAMYAEIDKAQAINSGAQAYLIKPSQPSELCNLVTEDIMRVGPIAVHGSTTLAEAAKRMEERGVLNLPVEEDGRVAYSVSRHDLLREWVALGLEMGLGGWRGI